MQDAKDTRILEAAADVFMRYGFRRTTMGDLAQAAGVSRPALYLRYCNKEQIFTAVCRRFSAQILEEIRQGVAVQGDLLGQLRFAFELWLVRPFILMAQTPDARDLADCALGFAREAVDEGYAAFEAELLRLLEADPGRVTGLGPAETAHILASTARGFKGTARSVEELRALVEGLLKLLAAGLAHGASPKA